MANPLEIGSGSPPPPNPDAGNALQQGAPQQPGPQQATAPPDHVQFVAALRHFDAVKGELGILLKNPSLGKSDLKKQIIDGTVKLVGERIMSPASAVDQLSKVPADPLKQRKWVTELMQQAVQAERGIIAHHAIGFAGGGPEPTPSADSHMDTMSALHAQYSGK